MGIGKEGRPRDEIPTLTVCISVFCTRRLVSALLQSANSLSHHPPLSVSSSPLDQDYVTLQWLQSWSLLGR